MIVKLAPGMSRRRTRVGSRGRITVRPSQLDLGVRVSPHPAPDVLSFRVCSCECSRGSFREWLEGYFSSNLSGFHRHDGDVPSRH